MQFHLRQIPLSIHIRSSLFFTVTRSLVQNAIPDKYMHTHSPRDKNLLPHPSQANCSCLWLLDFCFEFDISLNHGKPPISKPISRREHSKRKDEGCLTGPVGTTNWHCNITVDNNMTMFKTQHHIYGTCE